MTNDEPHGWIINRRSGKCKCDKLPCVCERSLFARVRYTDRSGQVKSKEKKVRTRTIGNKWIKATVRSIGDEGAKVFEASAMTFNDLAGRYAAAKLLDPVYRGDGEGRRKIRGLRSLSGPKRFLVTLRKEFGPMRLQSITHGDIEAFLYKRLDQPVKLADETTRPRAVATVNRELAFLRAMLRYAVQMEWLRSSPFGRGDALISTASEHERSRTLTHDEEIRLLDACGGEKQAVTMKTPKRMRNVTAPSLTYDRKNTDRLILKALIITALDTAMRKGEMLTLTWSDVDLPHRTISIKATNAKTERPRLIGMTKRVAGVFEWLRERSGGNAGDLVFGVKNNFKRSWGAVRTEAGIENLKFHDLRHTAITRMLQGGTQAAEVMKISGHTQLSTFLRYLNPDKARVVLVADQLDSFNQTWSDSMEVSEYAS